ncbi:MAG: hypothetical protein WCD26_21695, partial [Pseudolabrys sp.]
SWKEPEPSNLKKETPYPAAKLPMTKATIAIFCCPIIPIALRNVRWNYTAFDRACPARYDYFQQ